MSNVESNIRNLRERIAELDRLYYVEARPDVSDQDYDRLFSELKALEAKHPELIAADSPTQRVGEMLLGGFRQVEHAVPMLSIDNTYSEGDLREFDARVAKGLGGEPYEYVVDPKIDGVSATLRYEGGLLIRGATRGNGKIGDDITANLRTIRAIPLKLKGDGWPAVLEVRGEVFWPRKAFDACNDRRIRAGEEPFANPRNATTGALKSLDPRESAGRGLSFMAHGHGEIVGTTFQTAASLFDALRQWGLPTSPHREIFKNIDDVIAFVQQWDSRRRSLEYETDGLVVKVNDLGQRDRLGVTSRFPRWAVAFKYAAEQAESRLIAVDFQVGKLGTITPRAVMEPVQLSGTTVRHASLHNFDQVARLDVRIGDTVVVEKAGEIIPQVVRVIVEKRPPTATPIFPPTKCPVCGGDVEKDEGGVYLRCVNPVCDAQIKERLKYFCGRDQMDIEGIGESLVNALVTSGLVHEFADLYKLADRREKLSMLVVDETELGEAVAESIIDAVRQMTAFQSADSIPKLKRLRLTKDQVDVLSGSFPILEGFLKATAKEICALLGESGDAVARVVAFLYPTSKELLVKNVCYLRSSGIFEVKDIGVVTIERLVGATNMSRLADLLGLIQHKSTIAGIKCPRRLGMKSTQAILASIEKSKSQPLAKVLAALDIRHVGASTAELLADHFGSMDELIGAVVSREGKEVKKEGMLFTD